TPLPRYRSGSLSRFSLASCAPVEAPEGTAARPLAPSSRMTSTSTVGLPRLSRISRPMMSAMPVMKVSLESLGLKRARHGARAAKTQAMEPERGPGVVAVGSGLSWGKLGGMAGFESGSSNEAVQMNDALQRALGASLPLLERLPVAICCCAA